MKASRISRVALALALVAHFVLAFLLLGEHGLNTRRSSSGAQGHHTIINVSVSQQPPAPVAPVPDKPAPMARISKPKPVKAPRPVVPTVPPREENVRNEAESVIQAAGDASGDTGAQAGDAGRSDGGPEARAAGRDGGAGGTTKANSEQRPVTAEPAEAQADVAGGTAALAPPLVLATFPKPVRLSFDVHTPKDYLESNGPSNAATALIQPEKLADGADGYRIRIDIELNFLYRMAAGGGVSLQSAGRIGPKGTQTMRYSEKTGNRPERWLEVNAAGTQMRSYQVQDLKTMVGTQDRLSAIWMLGMVARGDPAQLEKGRRFTVPMFGFRKVYVAHFESLGEETLATPVGSLQSLHVRYATDEADSDKVDIWLGYDYEMQPVRIRWQEAEGRVIDLILSKKP